MTYVHVESELGVWTVGYYDPQEIWTPVSDHDNEKEAVAWVHYLNGGDDSSILLQLFHALVQAEQTFRNLLSSGAFEGNDVAIATNEVENMQATIAQFGQAQFGRTPRAVLSDPCDLEELVPIRAGPFWMGSDKTVDGEAYGDELPQHKVTLTEYQIGKYPVTVGQWRRFVEATQHPCDPASLQDHANHPVVNVSWRDARAYCDWLTGEWRKAGKIKTNETVRLPTEAEWEKAARGPAGSAGDKRLRTWGDDHDPAKANVKDTGLGRTSAVGCFPAGESPYHMLDMIGNVWEWTQSKFKPYPYKADADREDLEGDDSRVVRGGSFVNYRWGARCASRLRALPDLRLDYLGFRVACPGPGPVTDG